MKTTLPPKDSVPDNEYAMNWLYTMRNYRTGQELIACINQIYEDGFEDGVNQSVD